MSGFFALLDGVAAIAKTTAASLDDIATQAAKAGAKAAGVVIDDAAVTPQYVQGVDASRELPMIWRIAKGSLKNKLLILLPLAMALSSFAPWIVTPLLMLGGAYLCFEGAEKVLHTLLRREEHKSKGEAENISDPVRLEESRVRGAIQTDFILSAEVMTISLVAIPKSNFWTEAAVLATVGIGITLVVYGSVALIVKSDDVGMYLAKNGRLAITRIFGRGLVKSMPVFMTCLTIVGTAAMLWVGGSIVIHGFDQLGWHMPWQTISALASSAGTLAKSVRSILSWLAEATSFGIFGLLLGTTLVPLAKKIASFKTKIKS